MQFGIIRQIKNSDLYAFEPHCEYMDLFGYGEEEINDVIKGESPTPVVFNQLDTLVNKCFEALIRNYQRQLSKQPF